MSRRLHYEAAVRLLRDRLFATMETAHACAGNPSGAALAPENLLDNTLRNVDVLTMTNDYDNTDRGAPGWHIPALERLRAAQLKELSSAVNESKGDK